VKSATKLQERCHVLRSLHRSAAPLVLPNAWDVATAKAVVDAGFPVVATTSGGVAAALGYEDHEGAPADEMLAAAARISRAVDVPVTVDAEAGYGMEPEQLVCALEDAGAAGCNLEDTNHAIGELRDPAEHSDLLRGVREAASDRDYPLVINARIDLFLADVLSASSRPQSELVPAATARAQAYLNAGADCVFPILLWEREPLRDFISRAAGPVNILKAPPAPALAELAALGAARISYATLLHRAAMEHFDGLLASLATETEPWREASE
jgi:2-methylisocitrate lyase-like PEP mutase family enzyme